MPQPREIGLKLEVRADHVGSLKRLSVLLAAKPEKTNTLQGPVGCPSRCESDAVGRTDDARLKKPKAPIALAARGVYQCHALLVL
jgi:hypothetical protein